MKTKKLRNKPSRMIKSKEKEFVESRDLCDMEIAALMAGAMGDPELTIADDPLVALAILHEEIDLCLAEEAESSEGKYNAAFKAKAALEAIGGRLKLTDLARKLRVQPDQLGRWKKRVQEKASELFEKNNNSGITSNRSLIKDLS